MTEPEFLKPAQLYFEKDDFFKREYHLTPAPPDNIKIKYMGAADLLNFYKYVKYWLEDNGFISDENVLETRYTERTNPDGSKTTEIRWEGRKLNDNFFLYKLDIFFFIMNAKEVEVQWGDVKRNLTKAIFEIRLNGSLELDPPNPVTGKGKLDDYNFIKKWYYRSVIRKALNYHKAYWYNKIYELQELMKKFLKENSF